MAGCFKRNPPFSILSRRRNLLRFVSKKKKKENTRSCSTPVAGSSLCFFFFFILVCLSRIVRNHVCAENFARLNVASVWSASTPLLTRIQQLVKRVVKSKLANYKTLAFETRIINYVVFSTSVRAPSLSSLVAKKPEETPRRTVRATLLPARTSSFPRFSRVLIVELLTLCGNNSFLINEKLSLESRKRKRKGSVNQARTFNVASSSSS